MGSFSSVGHEAGTSLFLAKSRTSFSSVGHEAGTSLFLAKSRTGHQQSEIQRLIGLD